MRSTDRPAALCCSNPTGSWNNSPSTPGCRGTAIRYRHPLFSSAACGTSVGTSRPTTIPARPIAIFTSSRRRNPASCGYHHEWSTGNDTLALVSFTSDHLQLDNAKPRMFSSSKAEGRSCVRTVPFLEQDLDSRFSPSHGGGPADLVHRASSIGRGRPVSGRMGE